MKQTAYDKKLMQMIKTLRLRLNYKQDTLAKAINVSRTTFGRMEEGELGFTPGQFKMMVHELKASHYQLLALVDSDNRDANDAKVLDLHFKLVLLLEREDENFDFTAEEFGIVIETLCKRFFELKIKRRIIKRIV